MSYHSPIYRDFPEASSMTAEAFAQLAKRTAPYYDTLFWLQHGGPWTDAALLALNALLVKASAALTKGKPLRLPNHAKQLAAIRTLNWQQSQPPADEAGFWAAVPVWNRARALDGYTVCDRHDVPVAA